MSFFVSDQLKGHISEDDLLAQDSDNECQFILKVLDECIDVKMVKFQDEFDILTCMVKNSDNIMALLTDSVLFVLYYNGVKIKSWEGLKLMQSIYKDDISKMLFCDIIIKNELRGRNVQN